MVTPVFGLSLMYIFKATNIVVFGAVFQVTKNAPAQSYLSGGAIVPKETQGGNWIFASTRQARV